jgi:hypothetical protein
MVETEKSQRREPMRKVIQERTMFKLLIERTGALISITFKQRAFFFFFSTKLLGARVAPTTDPDPGIVEICDYDILTIVEKWDRLANIRLRKGSKHDSEPHHRDRLPFSNASLQAPSPEVETW